MGVNYLWEILSPVAHTQSVKHLKRKTVAVDLSSWVYKSLNCRFIAGLNSKKIMLRHVFFRIGCLLENDVLPILIIEGPAPTLKDSTLIKRRQNFYRTKNSEEESTSFHSRDKFIYLLQECQAIADVLGVPYVQSKGEAEALCAALNMSKIVAGCITDDSDAFLYGADVVYRNFCIKESVLTCYRMTDIQEKLKLDREKLVALAILLGCDFNANGIPGVGKEKAMAWIYTKGKENTLQSFDEWRQEESMQSIISEEKEQGLSDTNCKTEDDKNSKLESYIKLKFLSMKSSQFLEVIHEFIDNQPYPSDTSFELKEPSLEKILEIGTDKLGWSSEYSIKKIFPYITHWNMKNKIKTGTSNIKLFRVVKPRTVKSVPCLEIQWHKPEIEQLNDLPNDLFVTTEPKDLVSKAFPDVFQNLKEGCSSNDEPKSTVLRNPKRRSCQSVHSYKEDSDSSNDEIPKQRKKKCNQKPTYTKIAIQKYHKALARNTNNTGSVTYLKMVLDAFQGDATLQLSLQSIKKHIRSRYLVSENNLVFNKCVKTAIIDALQTETLRKVSGKGIGGTYQLNNTSLSIQSNKTAEEN